MEEFTTTKLYGFLEHILSIPVTSVIVFTATVSYCKTTKQKTLSGVAQVLGPVIQGTHFRIGQLLLLLVICIRWVPSELFQAGQNYLTWFKLCFGVSPIDLLFVCFLTLVKYYVTTWIYCHFMFWPDFISISMCIYDVVLLSNKG